MKGVCTRSFCTLKSKHLQLSCEPSASAFACQLSSLSDGVQVSSPVELEQCDEDTLASLLRTNAKAGAFSFSLVFLLTACILDSVL